MHASERHDSHNWSDAKYRQILGFDGLLAAQREFKMAPTGQPYVQGPSFFFFLAAACDGVFQVKNQSHRLHDTGSSLG